MSAALLALPLLAGCAQEQLPGALGEVEKNAVLPPERIGDHGVALDVHPSDAEVLIDGVVQGTAGDYDGRTAVIHLAEGRHTLTIRKKGFETYQSVLYGDGEGSQRIQVDLAPE